MIWLLPWLLLALTEEPATTPFASDLSWQTIGKDSASVGVDCIEGKLTIRTPASQVLYQSKDNEHCYGYSVAPFVSPGENLLLVWLSVKEPIPAPPAPHGKTDIPAAAEALQDSADEGGPLWINMRFVLFDLRQGQIVTAANSPALMQAIERALVQLPLEAKQVAKLLTRERIGHLVDLARYGFDSGTLAVEERVPMEGSSSFPDDLRIGPTTVPQADLLAVGDIMIGRGVGNMLRLKGYAMSFAAVRPLFEAVDWSVGNLESCFTTTDEGLTDSMNFFAPRKHLAALTTLGFTALCVANNHCWDGNAVHSKKVLQKAGIKAFGNVEGKRALFNDLQVLELGPLKVGIAGFMIFPTEAPQIRSLMTENIANQITAIKEKVDVLLLSVHWGVEYQSRPLPEQEDLAHWLIDHGVDGILGHHPHVIQTIETYQDGFIAYSLGNFLFDQQGAFPKLKGATELGSMLTLRVHKQLGIVWQEQRVRIVNRHQLVLEPAP